MGEEIKTFKDLTREVIDQGLCGKCGGCVSFCSAGDLNALKIGANGLPQYANEENCLRCGICYLICPQIDTLNADLEDRFGWKPPIGNHKFLSSAQTTDSQIMKVCTDGGVVTSLLAYLLENNLVNAALVSKKKGLFSREPIIATTREDLISAAGSQFSESYHLEELGGKYTTYAPMLSTVKALEKRYLRDVAIVGTPCQLNTIRKMQVLGIIPAHLVKYAIGLFCIENFSFDDLAREKLEKKLSIDMEEIHKLNVKEDLILNLKSGITIHIPLEELVEVARPACLACMDFSNEYADISTGGLGSPDGYTSVLVRTDAGETIFSEAIEQGYIRERTFETVEERRVEKTKMLAMIVSSSRRKRIRAENRLKELAEGKTIG
jgi:coenzyme F420 hydrogenase subunit beta